MKRVLAALFIGLIGQFGIGSYAQAQNQKQQNFMSHLARVEALSEKCPQWEIDSFALATAAYVFRIKMEDIEPGGQFHEHINMLYRKELELFSNRSNLEVCYVAAHEYGPAGASVKDLMVQTK